MSGTHRILVVNPGSTSTKIAVFDDDQPLFTTSLEHSNDELDQFDELVDQQDFRKTRIEQELNQQEVLFDSIDCIMGRGGLLRPVEGGVYAITPLMLEDLNQGKYGVHASNLGALLVHDLGKIHSVPSYVADPPVVDELQPLARYSGHPSLQRRSIFHALNQKAVARRAGKELDISYESGRFIVAHLGGGITVSAHKNGRVIDTNNGLNGDGPFTPERSGALPAGQLAELCFSGQYTLAEIKRLLTGRGGLMAYLGTNSGREISGRISQGDSEAKECYKAMAYQVAKEIGAQATVLSGLVDAVILTGGLMHDPLLRKWIQKRIAFIAPVIVYPGEGEMEALAAAGKRVITGEEAPKPY